MKGTFAKRLILFLLTNLAVIVVLGVVLRVLGVERWFAREGVELNYTALLVFAAIVGFAGSLFSLAISKWMAKTFTGARVIEEPRSEGEVWLVETVARLAHQAGIGMPEVAIYPSPDMNAFATGARRNHALVAVSEGLLLGMRPAEIEAVLAHEVSHVANGDMITLALLQGVLNTFVIFFARVVGFTVDRVLLRNDRDYGIGYWVSTIAAEIVFGILASLIVMWFSRQREYRADHGSATLVNPQAMIAALERLRDARVPSMLPSSLKTFGIRMGEGRGLTRLFMSHPPIEERIAALRERTA